MKRARLIFLASSLACLFATAAPAKDEIRKESFLSGGKKHTYSIYVPKSVEGSKTPAPLLVALHGSGRDGLSLVEKWKELAAKEGFIVVGPDALDPKGWFIPRDSPDPLHDLVEELKSKHPVDPRRVYLFGHSAGAGMALVLSVLESEYFAAVAVHAGALPTERYGLIDLAKRKTPISIIVGTRDPAFPLAAVRATRDELNKRGFDVQLSEIAGHDHWYYDRAAEFNLALWDFLKKQQLAAEPRYEQYQFGK
ncbi:MAG TPA: PHB depolymerase family esterase [Pyrinomonadaceae bacterium]|jgi:poly(3-hydroxybutyrate) depolymerase